MKTSLITLAVAVAALFAFAPEAEAGTRFSVGFSTGHHGHHINSYVGHSFRSSNHGHCAPVYKVRTCEVNRRRYCKTAYDHCGHPYTYHVTVVTYRDYYSNGTSRTYTRTFS